MRLHPCNQHRGSPRISGKSEALTYTSVKLGDTAALTLSLLGQAFKEWHDVVISQNTLTYEQALPERLKKSLEILMLSFHLPVNAQKALKIEQRPDQAVIKSPVAWHGLRMRN